MQPSRLETMQSCVPRHCCGWRPQSCRQRPHVPAKSFSTYKVNIVTSLDIRSSILTQTTKRAVMFNWKCFLMLTNTLIFTLNEWTHDAVITLLIDFVFQLNALLLYYVFFIFLYMFQAILCSSSGGSIVYTQHLVLYMSLLLGDRSVHR